MKAKILSAVLSAIMTISMIPAINTGAESLMAYKDSTDIFMFDSNIESNDNTENCWDEEALAGDDAVLYEDFPVRVEKLSKFSPELGLGITYLKTLSDNKTAHLTITDGDTNELIYDNNITSNIIVFDDLPMDKVYIVSLNETINGQSAVYDGVITTSRKSATFPSNVTIPGVTPSVSDVATVQRVYINKVSSDDDNYESPYKVQISDFPDYYNTLEADTLYAIQCSTHGDDGENDYYAFFSTSNELKGYGIFVPSFNFYTKEQYEDLMSSPSAATMTDLNAATVKKYATQYTDFKDIMIQFPISGSPKNCKIYRFVAPETGLYTIGTVGNTATTGQYWDLDSDKNLRLRKTVNGSDSKDGTNFSMLISAAEGYIMYFAVSTENANKGNTIFRIIAESESDDVSNYIYELDNNNGPKTSIDKTISSKIDYYGDTDVYYLDITESGDYKIKVTNPVSETTEITYDSAILHIEDGDRVVDRTFSTSESSTRKITTTLYKSNKNFFRIYARSGKVYGTAYQVEISKS